MSAANIGVPCAFCRDKSLMRLPAMPRIRDWWQRPRPSNIAISTTSWHRGAGSSLWWLYLTALKIRTMAAILRTADAAGADGGYSEMRSAAVTAAVAKVSAGASEHLPIAKVYQHIPRALEELKEKQLWVVGPDERAEKTYDAVDYKMHCAVVLGAGGKGFARLGAATLRFWCRFRCSEKCHNPSVAAGIVLYEVVRQRRLGASK